MPRFDQARNLLAVLAVTPSLGSAACDGTDSGRVSLTLGARVETVALSRAASHVGLGDQLVVDVVFCPESAAVLAEMTADAVGQEMSLGVDGDPLWSAVVMAPITGGKLQIWGAFTLEEIERKARRLRLAAGLTD